VSLKSDVGCPPVECRQPSLIETVQRVPPALAGGLLTPDEVKIEREVREHVPHRADGVRAGRYLAPVSTRKCRHSTEEPGCGATHEPDFAAAFDPPGGAVPLWARHARASLGIGFRGTACECRTIGSQRAIAAAGVPRPTNGRPEIHHCLDKIARVFGGHKIEEQAFDLGSQGLPATVQARNNPLHVRVDRSSLLAKGNRRDSPGRIGADARQFGEFC
jgi:hypothetical protein